MNDNADQMLAAGRGLFYTGKFADAERELKKLIARDASLADAWFMLGMTYRSLARQPAAMDACREAVRLDPSHAAAHNLLGILLAEMGRFAEAVEEFKRALALNPKNADTHFNLGLALLREQRVADAIEAWRLGIAMRPTHAGAQAMLRQYAPTTPISPATTAAIVGVAAPIMKKSDAEIEARLEIAREAFERGDFAAAEAACRESLKYSPTHSRAMQHLGVILISCRRFQEAEAELRRAVAAEPGDADNHYILGCALAKLENNQEAMARFLEALNLQPDHVLAHIMLGETLASYDRFSRAEWHLRRAIELQPEAAQAYCDLGFVLTCLGRNTEAEVACRRAIELKPNCAAAYDALGGALARQGRYADADEQYECALKLDPAPEILYNRSLSRLAQGHWLEAWPDYEHRFCTRELKGRQISDKPWNGAPLHGRTILLYADQALGDTLQCVRYVPLVARLGGRVLLACQRPLLPLLRSLKGVEQLLDQTRPPPDFDVQAALMSLPYLFGTTLDTVSSEVPYLSASPSLVDSWRQKLRAIPGVKIGIVWQGNPRVRPGVRRSIPLADYEPLARLRGVQLISLQKRTGTEQIAQVPFGDRIVDLSSHLDEESGPFMDTAAIMTQLDLVISCDTAVAHLAGALAVPVWLALPAVAEWRWLLDRDDTPWYPTMRLFRQPQAGNWFHVFERMVLALQERLGLREATDN